MYTHSLFWLPSSSILECSTGEAGRIHASKATAELLCAAGKEKWISKRPDTVAAREGGENDGNCSEEEVETYWIHAKSSDSISTLSNMTSLSAYIPEQVPHERLVLWHVDQLSRILKKVLVQREPDYCSGLLLLQTVAEGGDEDAGDTKDRPADSGMDVDVDLIPLGPKITGQIKAYVIAISKLYANHAFHNLDHAFLVSTSLRKMIDQSENGFNLDPLPEFAAIFAALIHELDHPGITNQELMDNKDDNASTKIEDDYKGKSITQFHAFHLAWIIFLDDTYTELRHALCPTDDTLAKFRTLTLDCVVSTDVMNPILSAARKRRWQKAFDTSANSSVDVFFGK